MTLGQLFSGITDIPQKLTERVVSGVTSDNREVESGFLFVCVKGRSFDGHSVAASMLEKGACAVVTERPLGLPAEICVNESRRLYPELLSAFYGRPTQKLCLGAVTGTNGKTTTVNLCAQITRALGHQTGVIGTVGCDTGKGLQYYHDGPPTTPEPRKLYQLFREMADIGTEYCFLEASSMALAQHRFAAESFAVGAFTNLTQDHLDYHGTMEEYYLAKRMLADMSRTMVINIDDEYGRRTADYCRMSGIQAVTTSVNTSGADYFAEFIRLHPHGAEFLLTCPEKQKSWVAKIPLTGLYNVSNAVQAAVMCRMMGFPIETLRAQGMTCATCESLTGGKVVAALVDIPGASAVVRAGLVTYQTDTKTILADVPAEVIERFGVVSVETACAMAEGTRKRLGVDIAVSTTGVAGPDGGTEDCPVGTVCVGVSTAGGTSAVRLALSGNRERIRTLAMKHALHTLIEKAR